MGNQLTTFKFEGADIQAITDEKGELWFVAKDVAAILEYSDPFEMTKRLDADEIQNLQLAGFGNRGVNIINESGLYSSVLGSRKPEAKKFKKWVNSEG
jgi:prophage antirepressor-like protein